MSGDARPQRGPLISLVVAAARNGVIGVDGDLPWRLPDDLRHFKRLTVGKPVVMGRKTYVSIGRALPERQNIVVTSNPAFDAPGCTVVHSPEAAMMAAGEAEELMIIGGGSLYRAFDKLADRIYLTRVDTELDGDTFFELPDEGDWRLVSSDPHGIDERHEHAFEFQLWVRD